MKELLEKWAKLEPNRCQFNEGNYLVLLNEEDWRYLASDLAFWDLIWIQGVVQQAIVSRKWSFEIKYNSSSPDPNYPYDVSVDSSKSGGWGISKDNVAEALLDAYLHTLEGETK